MNTKLWIRVISQIDLLTLFTMGDVGDKARRSNVDIFVKY